MDRDEKRTGTGRVFWMQFHHHCWAATKRPTLCWAVEIQQEGRRRVPASQLPLPQSGQWRVGASPGVVCAPRCGHGAEALPWLPEGEGASPRPEK